MHLQDRRDFGFVLGVPYSFGLIDRLIVIRRDAMQTSFENSLQGATRQ